ncbi:MAG: hypothetical protein J3Q66DRAFT_350215 [Benniella sp.]|nr:MAG: hypothetical protein J3Q66DRAFT_350215 [Benniella sp.]
MSGISARIDKGQTRFAPKLKARPNRSKATASEDGTPAPTSSIGSSDSGTLGTSSTESEAGGVSSSSNGNSNNNHTTLNTATTGSGHRDQRRLSTTTPLSSPAVAHNRTIVTPKSPIFTPTRVQKSTQATTIATPSQKSVSEPSSSSSVVAPTSSSSNTASKSSKGASIISVPSARSHTEMEGAEESETGESSTSSRKRAKGKQTRPKTHHATQNGEDGQEENENEEEEAWPDYANMYMYEFVKDLGVGRRSKTFAEHQKLLNQKRKENKKEERIRAIRIYEGRGPSPPRDDVIETGEAEDMEAEAQDDQEEGEEARPREEKPRTENSASKPAPTHKTFAPQVRVVDGRIELDMDSLTVDHAVVEAAVHQGPLEYVEESSSTKFVNSSTFNKRIRSERWSTEETELFYEALSQWGTDFGIICRLFPSKTRIAVRNKYKREDRLNHSRVEDALNNRKPIDLGNYSQLTGTAFPEVNEQELAKEELEKGEENQEPFEDHPGFEEDYDDAVPEEEEVVQEEEEEIVGMIE